MDNAATTKIRAEVLEAMMPLFAGTVWESFLCLCAGAEAHSALDAAREQMRCALNAAQAREIFFTSCGTESDNWAIFGAAHALRKRESTLSLPQPNTMPCWIPARRWKKERAMS